MTRLLQLAGLLHFAILIASSLVPGTLDWRRHLASLPPFLRQLFWVYGGFIVLTIIGFGALTLAHASTLSSGAPLGRSLCLLIALFWAARLAVQLFVFDAKPYLRNVFLRTGYHLLTVAFIYLAFVYTWAALL